MAAQARADCTLKEDESDVVYGYATGGDDWGTLKTVDKVAFELCSTGKKQSPIDLRKSVDTNENLDIHLYGY